jgi:diguanylate cyclase (GGDEF)-like protein
MQTATRYGITVILSLGVMGLAGLITHEVVISRAQEQFTKDTDQIRLQLDTNLKRYNDLLSSLHSFVISNDGVTKDQFDKYTNSLSLTSQYPAIHLLDITRYLKTEQLESFYKNVESSYSQDEQLKNIKLMHVLNKKELLNKKDDIEMSKDIQISDVNLQERLLKGIALNKLDVYASINNKRTQEHYIVQYATPISKAYNYIGLNILNGFYTLEELNKSKKLQEISSSGKIFTNRYNGEYPFIMIRQPVLREEGKVLYGSVGASIRFDHTLFSDLNRSLSYIEFQIYSAEEDGKGLVYDSRFHRVSTETAWPKNLFDEKIHQLINENKFNIGNKEFFIKTFSSNLPPNFTDLHLVVLVMFLSFGITFGTIYFGIFKKIEREDVSNKTEAKVSHLKRQAHTDELTGLCNRRAFFIELEEKMKIHNTSQTNMYLFFIDLDGFKRVNDTLGHSAGDAVLKEYAERLNKLSESNVCNAYRIGGDEFTVILETGLKKDVADNSINGSTTNLSPVLTMKDVEVFTEQLLKLTEQPFVVKEERFTLSQSVGVAQYPDNGPTSEDLFKNSDMAMYEAKRQGRNCYVLFTQKFSEEIAKRNRIINELNSAVENNEFYLEYQPKMKKEGEIYSIKGVEALIRWHNQKLGNLSPGIFIPLAEEAGLMPSIGNWLIKEVVKTMSKWKDSELESLKVAINLSAKQFNNDSLPDYYYNMLKIANINPNNIIIEITESAMMNEPAKTKLLLDKFRHYGFGVSVDDFGTGHSSLSYLRQFPVTEIKIDKSFTDDILMDEHDSIIVEGIISMSQKLKLDVVVEGVESLEQVQWIENQQLQNKSQLGIKIQGYYFSKPLKEDKLCEFIKTNRSQTPFITPTVEKYLDQKIEIV